MLLVDLVGAAVRRAAVASVVVGVIMQRAAVRGNCCCCYLRELCRQKTGLLRQRLNSAAGENADLNAAVAIVAA